MHAFAAALALSLLPTSPSPLPSPPPSLSLLLGCGRVCGLGMAFLPPHAARLWMGPMAAVLARQGRGGAAAQGFGGHEN